MFLENTPHHENKVGWIEVVCGSMFSGKTEELIRRMKRAQFAKQKVEIFKPAIDKRYDDVKVVSHDSNEIHSWHSHWFQVKEPHYWKWHPMNWIHGFRQLDNLQCSLSSMQWKKKVGAQQSWWRWTDKLCFDQTGATRKWSRQLVQKWLWELYSWGKHFPEISPT